MLLKFWALVLGLILNCVSLQAKNFTNFGHDQVQIAQSVSKFSITPSEAANIAMGANPGAKVLNVKLLPSGVYAVTLRLGGNVSRVLVDATTGSIS